MSFTTTQIESLKAPLDRSVVKERKQAGRRLSYIEGWQVIAEANRIFGFGAWSSETIDIRAVSEAPRKIGEAKRDGFGVSYVARVRVTVTAGEATIIREGVGSGHGIDVDIGLAHESAIKEAETDARKRALMTFGNPFGLALYDKTQANVVGDPDTPEPPARSRNGAALHTNGKPIDLSSSQRLAQNMMAALWKVSGEGVLDVTEDERFIRDMKVLEPDDANRVNALVHERRAIQ